MRVAVSACLLGVPCRYDGRAKPNEAALALRDLPRLEIVEVCPESAGGLRIPRPASEIVTAEGTLRVVNSEGLDVTREFVAGARATLERIREAGCRLAVLKAKSPSCGSHEIYDGTFSGTLVPGAGVAVRLLRAEGVRVVDEVTLRRCVETSRRLHPGSVPALFAESAAECPRLETDRLVLRAFGSAPHVFSVFEKAATECNCGDGETGQCIGSVGLVPDATRENPDCMALRFSLAANSQDGDLMAEAAREVVRYGFEELGLDRIGASRFTPSDRSRRVIEKCGFEREVTRLGDARHVDR